MDISKTIAELKARPDFNDNVGMILVHNGTVRGWSRKDRATVAERFMLSTRATSVPRRARVGLRRPGLSLVSDP